jgi:hypothetical protein
MKNRNVIFTTLFLASAWFLSCHEGRAVVPPPDGGYPGGNTAEGQNALFSLTTGEQQKEFEARLEQQDASIQRVDDRIKLSEVARQTVANSE